VQAACIRPNCPFSQPVHTSISHPHHLKGIIMKEYKAVIYQENALSSLLFGTAKIDPVRFSAFLNTNAKQGWRVVTMEKDVRRMFLFWEREAYVVILEREDA
jgi:hypothetical protein